jgi:protein SCO1/2
MSVRRPSCQVIKRPLTAFVVLIVLNGLPCGLFAAGLPAFQLMTMNGEPFSEKDLAGKPVALFFGFTRCPDICPTSLFEVSQDLESLGPEAGNLKALFVTVDPERDTPATLKEYLSSFDPRIIGLTGSSEVIAALSAAYGAKFKKIRTTDDYTFDHSASVFLLGRDGNYFGALGVNSSREMRLSKLKQLLN